MRLTLCLSSCVPLSVRLSINHPSPSVWARPDPCVCVMLLYFFPLICVALTLSGKDHLVPAYFHYLSLFIIICFPLLLRWHFIPRDLNITTRCSLECRVSAWPGGAINGAQVEGPGLSSDESEHEPCIPTGTPTGTRALCVCVRVIRF